MSTKRHDALVSRDERYIDEMPDGNPRFPKKSIVAILGFYGRRVIPDAHILATSYGRRLVPDEDGRLLVPNAEYKVWRENWPGFNRAVVVGSTALDDPFSAVYVDLLFDDGSPFFDTAVSGECLWFPPDELEPLPGDADTLRQARALHQKLVELLKLDDGLDPKKCVPLIAEALAAYKLKPKV